MIVAQRIHPTIAYNSASSGMFGTNDTKDTESTTGKKNAIPFIPIFVSCVRFVLFVPSPRRKEG